VQNIRQLASKFRRAIENAKNEGAFSGDQMFRNFPQGCCGITSELLARFLIDNDIKIKLTYVCGTYRDPSFELPSHAWLKINKNTVIDITGDQFKYYPEPLYFNEAIYVGPYTDFYNLFETNVEEICDNYFPLIDNYIRNYISRKKLYEIILKYIN